MKTNRRLFKGRCERFRDLISPSPLLTLRFIFCLILFSSFTSFAQTDSSKNKVVYDLNDPRNPNCPCHKLQKQAEDEFALLNNAKNKDSTDHQQDLQNENHLNYSNNSNSASGFSKRKKSVFIVRRKKYHFSNRAKKLWQEHSFSVNCFRW